MDFFGSICALLSGVHKNGNHFTVIISVIFESGKCYMSVTIFITVMWNTREEVEDGSRESSITGWLLAAGLTPEYRHLAGWCMEQRLNDHKEARERIAPLSREKKNISNIPVASLLIWLFLQIFPQSVCRQTSGVLCTWVLFLVCHGVPLVLSCRILFIF